MKAKSLLKILLGGTFVMCLGVQAGNLKNTLLSLPSSAAIETRDAQMSVSADGSSILEVKDANWRATASVKPKATAADSVTVKMTFVYDATQMVGTEAAIVPGSMMLYNADQKFSQTYNIAKKLTTLTYKIPKGTYDAFCYYTITLGARDPYNGCSQIVVVKENLPIMNDTTITMDIALAKHHIHVVKKLPGGEACNWGTLTKASDGTSTYSADKNVDYQAYWVYYMKKGIDKYIMARTIQNAGGKTINADATVSDLSNLMDFYTSDLSDNYQLYTTYEAYGSEKSGVTGPYLMGISKIGATINDTVSNDPAGYLTHEEYFKVSPEGEKAAMHLPGFKLMTLNGSYPLLGVRDYTRENIAAGTPVKIWADFPKKDANNGISVILNAVYGDYVTTKTTTTGTSLVIKYNSGPRFTLNDDGTATYINNGLDATTFQADSTLGHNNLEAYSPYTFAENKSAKIMACDNVPATVVQSTNYYNATYGSKYLNVHPYFVGRYGEVHNVDYDSLAVSVKYNGAEVHKVYNTITSFLTAWAKAKHPDGVMSITFTNRNIQVDTLKDCSVTSESVFDQTKTDWTAPTIQMLQLRKSDGTVTHTFDKASDGVVGISAGDFNYDLATKNFDCKPVSVTAAYSPNKAASWTPLELTANASLFRYPAFGSFYSGSLAPLANATSSNEWYDLKVVVTDEAGNSQTQVFSPAFRIKPQSGVSTVMASSAVRAFIDGSNLTFVNASGASVALYTAAGQCVATLADASQPLLVAGMPAGVYIAQLKKGSTLKSIKILIK